MVVEVKVNQYFTVALISTKRFVGTPSPAVNKLNLLYVNHEKI